MSKIGLSSNQEDEEKELTNEEENAFNDLLRLWRRMEEFVEAGTVFNLGLCDVQVRVFKKLYDEAKIKPKTVQVSSLVTTFEI